MENQAGVAMASQERTLSPKLEQGFLLAFSETKDPFSNVPIPGEGWGGQAGAGDGEHKAKQRMAQLCQGGSSRELLHIIRPVVSNITWDI